MRYTLMFLFLAGFALRAGAQSVSLEDIRGDFSKGDYRVVVQKTSNLFSSTYAEPSPGDKYALLMLRGESQLQMKDRLGAVTSFKSAAKAASDVNQMAEAKANALIIDRSSMGRYSPRTGTMGSAIDILPPESRKQAMAALQADLWSQNKLSIDAAMRATTLPPIEKVFVPLADMFSLEFAATGKNEVTGKVMRDLGQTTYRLMQAEVTRYSRRIEQLNQTANSSSGYGGDWAAARQGLTSTERNEVKEAAGYLVKVRDQAIEYRGIANRVGGNEQRWDAMVLELTDTLAAAESLYNDR